MEIGSLMQNITFERELLWRASALKDSIREEKRVVRERGAWPPDKQSVNKWPES